MRTRDRDVAAAAFNTIVEHRPRVTLGEPGSVDFRIRSADWANMGADLIRSVGARYETHGHPLSFLLAGVLTGGRARLTVPGAAASLRRGDGFLYPVHASYRADFIDVEVADVRLPLRYVSQVAQEVSGLASEEVRFSSMEPVSEVRSRQWLRTVRYLTHQLTAPASDLPLLLADQLLRLGACSVLTTFPHSAATAGSHAQHREHETPATVRRAQAFIEAHAGHPIMVADIATVAGVGPRGLQLAFRRHLGVTPMAYLRRERLRNVRRELLTADPQATPSVAQIAQRWGFTASSRFAGEYRSVYGELPSRTLATARKRRS